MMSNVAQARQERIQANMGTPEEQTQKMQRRMARAMQHQQRQAEKFANTEIMIPNSAMGDPSVPNPGQPALTPVQALTPDQSMTAAMAASGYQAPMDLQTPASVN